MDLEIQMGAERQPGAADAADPLPGFERPGTIGYGGRDHAEMGIERLKSRMLHQHLQPAHAFAVDANDMARRHGQNLFAGCGA